MKHRTFFTGTIAVIAAFAMLPGLHAQPTVAVVNAASFEAGFPLSPGSWATAFGDFASVGVLDTLADTVPFPTILGGVQVFVNDVEAPMNFVGGTQINFLVPKETPSEGRVPLRIAVAGNTTYEGTLNMWPISPALISTNPADVTKPGAVLNQDSTVNSQENPAQRGEVIQIFGVGADFAELPANGEAASLEPPLIPTQTTPVAYVSVAEAVVQFSGLAPGLVNAWQLNVFVPDQPFVKGQVPVVAEINGLKTNLVSIWVAE